MTPYRPGNVYQGKYSYETTYSTHSYLYGPGFCLSLRNNARGRLQTSRRAHEPSRSLQQTKIWKKRSVEGCKSDFNILANLQAKGVDAPSSCTNGTCNVCAALVEAGMENIVAEVEASALRRNYEKEALS